MMGRFNKFYFCALLSLPIGCASRVQLLDAEIVSMSSDKMPGSGAKKGVQVESKWCRSEEPFIPAEDRVYGLIDQVIAKAEKEAGASYLANVSIYEMAVNELLALPKNKGRGPDPRRDRGPGRG